MRAWRLHRSNARPVCGVRARLHTVGEGAPRVSGHIRARAGANSHRYLRRVRSLSTSTMTLTYCALIVGGRHRRCFATGPVTVACHRHFCYILDHFTRRRALLTRIRILLYSNYLMREMDNQHLVLVALRATIYCVRFKILTFCVDSLTRVRLEPEAQNFLCFSKLYSAALLKRVVRRPVV